MINRDETIDLFAEVYDLHALAAIETQTAVRRAIAQSIASQYPPCEETPTKLGKLLERLDVANSALTNQFNSLQQALCEQPTLPRWPFRNTERRSDS